MLALFAFGVLLKFICASSITDLPSYFPRCHVDDPDIAACVLKASNDVRPYIKKGVPELDIPSVDPLIVPEIKLEQGTDAVNYKIRLTNATVQGLGDYDFKDFTYDPKALLFHGSALFKSLSLDAKYEIDGKILVAPIRGKGNLKATLGQSTGHIDVKGELVQRKGAEYYNPKEVITKIVISDVESSFDGLFDGNEELAQATNRLLKEQSSEIVKEITPAIEKVAEELVRKMMLGINRNIPYNKLLPPSH